MKKLLVLFPLLALLLFQFTLPVSADVSPPGYCSGIFRYTHEGWRTSGIVMTVKEAEAYMDNDFLKKGMYSENEGNHTLMDKCVLGVLYRGDRVFDADTLPIDIHLSNSYLYEVFSEDWNSDMKVAYDVARLEIRIGDDVHVLAEDVFDENNTKSAEGQCKNILDMMGKGSISLGTSKVYESLRMRTPKYVVSFIYGKTPAYEPAVNLPISWFDFSESNLVDAEITLSFYRNGEVVSSVKSCSFSLEKVEGGYRFQGKDIDVDGYIVGHFHQDDLAFVQAKPNRVFWCGYESLRY